MKKLFLATLLLTSHFLPAFSQTGTAEYQKLISDFITCVKKQDKEGLAKKIVFPLKREYPLPPIKNKQEFLSRYNEVFDDSLVRSIVTSAPDKDWLKMGWRGIMLHHGQLWLNEEGKLIAVNYQSAVESKKRALLVEKERGLVHSSLKEFKRPVCLLETGKFRIRIDEMGDGHYRYASWSLKNKQSDKPDLIIENGEFIPEGTGGNHRYEFKTNGYVYNCSVIVLGAELDGPPAELIIYKGEKELLSQPATIAE